MELSDISKATYDHDFVVGICESLTNYLESAGCEATEFKVNGWHVKMKKGVK